MVSHVVSGRFLSHAFVLVPLTWFPSTHDKFQINLTQLGSRALAHLIPASGRVVSTSFVSVLSQEQGSDMLVSVGVQAPAHADWLATDFNWMAPAGLSNVI